MRTIESPPTRPLPSLLSRLLAPLERAAARDAGKDWGRLGEEEAYWAVVTHPRYRSGALDEEAKAAFFATGEGDAAWILGLLRAHCSAPDRFRSALDFGCGVGRLLLPISTVADRAAGVDVAESMRAHCAQSLRGAGAAHASVHASIAEAAAAAGPFEWVNSYIVLQHVPPALGYDLVRDLCAALAPGGWLSLHVTVDRAAALRAPRFWPLRRKLLELSGRLRTEQLIQMFDYDLGRVLAILREADVQDIWLAGTDHGGHYGCMLCGRRRNAAE